MLTAKQFAKRAGVAYPTVMKWLRENIIPDANLITESPLGNYWQIPVTSLDAVEKRKPGPKPKAKAAEQNGDQSGDAQELGTAKPAKKARKKGSHQ